MYLLPLFLSKYYYFEDFGKELQMQSVSQDQVFEVVS